MKKTMLLWCAFLLSAVLSAQDMDDLRREFNSFREQEKTGYSDFVKKRNAEYQSFIEQPWIDFEIAQGKSIPVRPEPPKPETYKQPQQSVTPTEISVESVSSASVVPAVAVKQENNEPQVMPENVAVNTDVAAIVFYGNELKIPYTAAMQCTMRGTTEKDVAEIWGNIAASNYAPTMQALQAAKQQLQLNDWAYLLLCKTFAQSFFSDSETNESIVLQMFLLVQSGYKVKTARCGNNMILLVGTIQQIYQLPFLEMEGTKYYVFTDRKTTDNSLYTYKGEFGETPVPLNMQLAKNPSVMPKMQQREFTSAQKITTFVHVNVNLMDFYNAYPQCDYGVYAHVPMSEELKADVLPALKQAIQDKNQLEAANIILNYVQTAFAYKTDNEQFGYEKPFFVDEMFYYPYSDCEDRATLFACLVHELLALPVVLLDYPNHIAAAVCFSENTAGDYLTYKGKHYTICDPTYIGAPVGRCMPQYKTVAAKIIE